MNRPASLLGLLPRNSNLEIEQVLIAADSATLIMRTNGSTARCPRCGHCSQRVHSRYPRKLADLAWQGRQVVVRLTTRRFFCVSADCEQKIFVERLPELAGVYARTTRRLAKTHGQIGLALGGEAGSRLADKLAMPRARTRCCDGS